jgi:hypothetical protein
LKEEFFKRFQRIKDELDNVVKDELEKWLFEEKVQELLKEREEKLTKVTEYEIRELLKWGYDREEIFEEDIIKEYRRLDTEINIYDDNKEKVKEKLDKYIEIWKNEYAELEKLAKEIMGRNIEENDKRKDENPKENKEDQNVEKLFEDEEKDEDKSEKLINTDGIYSRQDSDQERLNLENINSDNESDISDFYIENLFEDTNNMATIDQFNRALERTLGFPDRALNNPLGQGMDLATRIDNT